MRGEGLLENKMIHTALMTQQAVLFGPRVILN
jgi:hypothetical protein